MWPVWCAQNNAIESSTKAYEVMGLMRRNWHVRGQRFLTEGEMRNKIEKIGQPTSHPTDCEITEMSEPIQIYFVFI